MAEQTPEPAFETVARGGDLEVRRYEPMILASTLVPGDRQVATQEGFRRLASYIFGSNAPRAHLAMTRPVTTRPEGERIQMTAPVTSRPEGERWRVSFVMPPGYSLETLPAPTDDRILLEEVPARRVAAWSFSGWATERSVRRNTSRLLEALVARGLVPSSEPVIAQYDPPWRLPFLRRNEILVDLAER